MISRFLKKKLGEVKTEEYFVQLLICENSIKHCSCFYMKCFVCSFVNKQTYYFFISDKFSFKKLNTHEKLTVIIFIQRKLFL